MNLAMLTGSQHTKLGDATFATQGLVYDQGDRIYLAMDSARFLAADSDTVMSTNTNRKGITASLFTEHEFPFFCM